MAEPDASSEEDIEISAAPEPKKPGNPWIPLLVAIVVMPVLSYAMTQFVLLPMMKESLKKAAIEGVTLSGAEKAAASSGSLPGKKKEEKPTTFECPFDNIVVNVSGTKGTRYLKTSFTVFSSNPELKAVIARHKPELQNLTLNILSAKTLVDLEASGAKNILLNELLENFNQTLKSTLIEQIYFSEFVIQ